MSEQDVVFSELVLSLVTPEKVEVRRFTPFEELEEEPTPEQEPEPVRSEPRRVEKHNSGVDGGAQRQGRKRRTGSGGGEQNGGRPRRSAAEGGEKKEGGSGKRRRRRGRGKDKNGPQSAPAKKKD